MVRQDNRPGRRNAESPLPFDDRQWNEIVAVMELSPQQARIVELLLRGLRDKEIAHELDLGVPTVRTYFRRIFDRAQVEDRVGLILRILAIVCRSSTPNQRHPE